MCHPGPISAPAHDPRPLSGLGMRAGATRWVLGSQCHQGTLRCPLLPLQPPRCLGSFSHLGGAQPSMVTHWPPCAPHGNALSPSPGSPGAPAHPRRFPECRDELIAIPAAFPLRKPQAFLRGPRCWFITPCPRQAGDSAPVPPRAPCAGPAAAPARSHRTDDVCRRKHRPVPPLSPGLPQVSCGTPSHSVCPSGFLGLYPFPLGEQSIPGYLAESSPDAAVPAVPYKQSLGTTCGRPLTSCRDAKPHTALVGSPWSIPAGTGSCRAGRSRCDRGWSHRPALAASMDVVAQISVPKSIPEPAPGASLQPPALFPWHFACSRSPGAGFSCTLIHRGMQ